ncbi:methyl-accepting chemotaxis protein [Labrenzia sp. VG12]|uniref:methyl-accepting chemotaxis protein n=1 Tax=Labrenzia sp. VG12 TaxID=2021862 RepID=UPI000B8BD25B|nr:methyl-accepting chemotaxis protein [Labrenzia sp. VG12]ASP34815.1 chemotaxis protein [Labrenzia sp. VG12]
MWNSLSIRYKIPVAILGVALSVGAGIGLSSYFSAAKEIRQLTETRLQAIAQSRVTELSDYLAAIEADLLLVGDLPFTLQATQAFSEAFEAIEGDRTARLKTAYISDNPNPLGQKHLLDAADTGTDYDAVHARFHPWFRSFLTERGYYDIFLFNLEGDLVYTVFKEEDFATNFSGDGPWADTDLGKAFRAAARGGTRSNHFFDFEAYAPSHGAPASFIAKRIEEDGSPIGVLVFQMPIDRINTIMSRSAGLGATGETIIVGNDKLLRNDSRFSEINDILATRVEHPATETVLGGSPALFTGSSHRDSSFTQAGIPLDFLGTSWAVFAMQSESEAMAPLTSLKVWMIGTGLALFIFAMAGGYSLALTITRPLGQLIRNIRDLIDDRLDTQIDGTDRADEIGDMKRAMAVFRDNALEVKAHQEEAVARRAEEDDRRRQTDQLVETFKTRISTIQEQLTSLSSVMNTTSQTLVETAGTASVDAESALSASRLSDESVQASAVAAEQLRISIEEINQHTDKALSTTLEAADAAQATDRDVTALAGSAEKIGAVISMIRDIAEQTNLLALNATIEAARAGEAGKGFAVVASEVKELSTQTAKATDEISAQVAAVQTSTHRAVEAIRAIGTRMDSVQEMTTAIASAVEEQGAATGEISKAMSMAADGSTQAAGNVAGLQGSIDQTRSSSGDIDQLSRDLSDVSATLSQAVDDFLSAQIWQQQREGNVSEAA